MGFWLIVGALAGLAGLAGLAAAWLARRRLWGGPGIDAIAVGVTVGLLVAVVPRLTGGVTVLLARVAPALQPAEARGLAVSVGPLVIQNLAAALIIGVYILTLRRQRKLHAAHTRESFIAPLLAAALAVFALTDGMVTQAGSLPGALSPPLVGGLALNHVCRGLALAGGLAAGARGWRWLATAALLGGVLEQSGAALARALGFEQTTVVAAPLLTCAVALLVVTIATILGPGLGSNLRRLPAPGFLAGLGLTLVAARLPGPGLL